jgi:hemerythrin-like domain-containing protein
MTDVFDVLAADHAEVRKMLAELQQGPARATGATRDQLLLRKKMAEDLVIAESRHESLEEMYFWPAVREHVPDGDALADEAINQEQEGKATLGKLDKAQADQPEFEALLGAFIKAAHEHIHFEETRVWPRARTALRAQEAEDLGTRIAEGRKTAPTRPHPLVPGSPEALKTVGPAAAAMDKIRDAATGRGN